MNGAQPWHRLFGLSWIDFFRGTSVTVETEVDLSLKHQFLDLLIIRKDQATLPRPLSGRSETAVLARHEDRQARHL